MWVHMAVLTFEVVRPIDTSVSSTSMLVPLDRCWASSSSGMLCVGSGVPLADVVVLTRSPNITDCSSSASFERPSRTLNVEETTEGPRYRLNTAP